MGWGDGVWVRDGWGGDGRQGGCVEAGGEEDGVRWVLGCHRSGCYGLGCIGCVTGMME